MESEKLDPPKRRRELNRFTRGWKFLPWAKETFESVPTDYSVEQVLDKVPNEAGFMGIKNWRTRVARNGSIILRLNAYNRFPFSPKLTLRKTPSDTITIKMNYGLFSKFFIAYWLFVCVVVYSGFTVDIIDEYLHGDGLTPLTVNGEDRGMVAYFPWIPLFVFGSFMFMFGGAVLNLTLGWRKCRALVDDILATSRHPRTKAPNKQNSTPVG